MKKIVLFLLLAVSAYAQSTTVNVRKSDGVLFTGTLGSNVYPNITQYASDEQDIANRAPTAGRFLISLTEPVSGFWVWDATSTATPGNGVIDANGYLTGRWIRQFGGTTAPTLGASQGVVLDSNKRLVASTATKQQIDKTAMNVATIAALKALSTNINSGQVIVVGGYYSSGDGGGGSFWFDAADTTSVDNGGSIIVSTSGGMRFKRITDTTPVSVLAFGAKADDGTDDTTKMQAWLDYLDSNRKSGTLPKGTFDISSTLVVGSFYNFDSGTIFGEAKLAEIKQNSTNTAAIELRTAWSLRNFKITASVAQPNTATNSVGLLLNNVHMGVIDGLVIDGFSYGIRKKPENGNYVFSELFQNLMISRSSNWAIEIARNGFSGGDSGSVIQNVYIQNRDTAYSGSPTNAVGGVRFESVTDSTLVQVNVEWSNLTGACYKFEDCWNVQMISPHVEGINFIGTGDAKVFDNTQSKLSISGFTMAAGSVTNTLSSFSIFYGFGAGATTVNGFYQTTLTNTAPVTAYRFNLPNAGHVGRIVAATSDVKTDNVLVPPGFAPNYVADFDVQPTALSWNTNTVTARTNLAVASALTVGSTANVAGLLTAGASINLTGKLSIGGGVTPRDININNPVLENGIYFGSYADSGKAFSIYNANGTLFFDGSGASSREMRFMINSSDPKLILKDGGQLNFRPIGAAPSSPSEGDVYMDGALKKLRVYNGTTWDNLN